VDNSESEARAQPEVEQVVTTSLFCDDIRMEATGKLTLIGCYPGNVILANPAQPIDRLCIYTKVIWGKDFDASALRLRVDLPAQEPNFMDVQTSSPATDETPGLATCVMNLRFPPLRVGDRLRVGVTAGSRLFYSGELLVIQAAPPATRH
jgi:hypothetical protein